MLPARRIYTAEQRRERARESGRRCYQKYLQRNREKNREKARRYREMNPEYYIQYYHNNIEKERERSRAKKDIRRQRYQTNPQIRNKILEDCRRYHRTHPKTRQSSRIQSPEYYYKMQKTTINFKGNNIILGWTIRKGICFNCLRLMAYIGNVGKTDMHHKEYFMIFPWFATIELCRGCHMDMDGRLDKLTNINKKY